MLTEMENAIVNQLSSTIKDWKVEALANPQDLERPVQTRQIFVVFRRESLESPSIVSPHAPISQARTIEFDVMLRSVDLRSHQGVYGAIDQVREQLTGFIPTPHAKGMYELSAQFVSSAEGIWLYGMSFGCKVAYQKRRYE